MHENSIEYPLGPGTLFSVHALTLTQICQEGYPVKMEDNIICFALGFKYYNIIRRDKEWYECTERGHKSNEKNNKSQNDGVIVRDFKGGFNS